MITALLVCVALLWVAVAGLVFVVFALVRQIGVLHERVAPVGALTVDQGPKVGDPAPFMELSSLIGEGVTLGRAQANTQMLFFLSPSCPVCKKLMPILRSLVGAESGLEIILASDGDRAEQTAFVRAQGLDGIPYVVSAALGLAYQVGRLPFAALLDERGILRARGLVNSREHLESLFEAKRLGVASLQEYFSSTA